MKTANGLAITYRNKCIGMNYYHESMGYIERSNAEIDQDMDTILAVMTSSHLEKRPLKVYFNPYNQDNLANCKNIVVRAKAKGLYVIWTENDDNTEITTESWDAYKTQVVADALEAQDAGADEFLVGNELSIHNDGSAMFANGTFEGHIKTLAGEVTFSGGIGYQEVWSKKDTWYSSGLGDLYRIYFNLYETIEDFKSTASDIYAKFPVKGVIGEYSTQSTYGNSATSEEDWRSQLLERTLYLKSVGFGTVFPFCFKEPSDDGFGFHPSTGTRQAWDILHLFNT